MDRREMCDRRPCDSRTLAVIQEIEIDGQLGTVHQDFNAICLDLRELQARRKDLIRARTGLTNRIRAITRRFVDVQVVKGEKDSEGLKHADKLFNEISRMHRGQKNDDDQVPAAVDAYAICLPFFSAREPLDASIKLIEKEMIKCARKLPAYDWVKSVRGFGEKNLACIIGETGDLFLYANPAKVWKRLGLAVIHGERQRKTTDAELAIEMGYSPTRRSAVYLLGESLIKGQGKDENAGPYRRVYDVRKAYELERDPEMKPAHAHARAKRYMEKRVIRDLWRAWRASTELSARGRDARRLSEYLT